MANSRDRFIDFVNSGEADRQRQRREEERAAQQQIAEQDRQRRQQNIDRGIEEFRTAQANGQLPPPRPGTRTAAELNYTGANPATAINPTVHVGMVSRNAEVRDSSPEANVEWDHNEINRDVLYGTDTAPNTSVATTENISQGRTPAFNFEDFAESLENEPQISQEDADLIRYQYNPTGFGERESSRTPQNIFEKYNIDRNNETYREKYEYSQAVSKYESLSDEDKEYIDIIMKANDDNKSADWEYISSYFSGSGTGSRRNTTSSLAAIEEAKEHLRSKGYTDREIQLMVHYHTANRNKEYSEYWQGEFENFAREHPFAAGATSVAMSLATPIGAVEYVESEINDTPVDLNSVYWSPTIIKDTIREEQSSAIEENHGRGWSKVYEHGMSGADMVLTSLVSPSLGLKSTGGFLRRLPTSLANNIVNGSFLGAQAATSSMRDVSARGGTNEQAYAMGSAVFLIEALTEALSLGELRNVASSGKRGIINWVFDTLWAGGVNLSEEGFAQIGEIVADNVIMGDRSRYNLLIKELMQTEKEDGTNYTRGEAEQLAKEAMAWEVVEAALGGAALGSALGGIGGAYGQGRQYVWDAALGYDIRQSGMASDVVAVARNSTDPNVTQWVKAINKTDKTTGQTNVRDDVLGGTFRALSYANTQQVVEADNMFADIDNLDDLEVAYRNKIGVKNKISPIAKKITDDYKYAKSVIKDGGIIRRPEKAEPKTATQSSSSLEVRTETAENAQPTQSTQSAEVKAFTPEQKEQTTNPTVGRTAEGKAVSVSDITDIKNGQIFVKTSDGKTQALKYADIGNAQARKVWEMAAKSFTDPKAAKAFIDNYNGEMVSDYANAFNDYYQLASAGMSLEQINEAGVAKGNISLAAKVAAVDAGAMSISYRKGVVDQTTTKKTKMQSLQMQMLDRFGKKYGLNITFVNTLGDFNGFYKPGTNQIVVGLDASEGAVTRTVGHEVYHYIKDANKEGAQKIEDFVLKSLKKLKGEEWVQNKLDSYDKSVYKTEQERIDELVADSMFDVFTNEKTVQEFVKQDRGLAQRVLDRVKTLIADIRNIYNKLIARGSDEISALRNELETLEKIRDLFFEALDETAPAVNQKQKNTAEAVKKSKKNNPDIKYSKKNKSNNPIREEVSDYIGSNAHVQSVIKTIDKRYRLAGKKKLNEKSIERFANKILSQTNSKYSKEQLTERLTALFEFMANSRDFSWDDIMQITAEISKDVLSQSSKLDTSMRDEFSDTLKWLKGIDKVYISPEVRAEIDATFGSLDSFRRQIGSRMKITVTDSNAISLDSVWSQLAGDYPGVFDSELTPLDQPAALADFFEMTKPTYQNPYEMDMDEAAYDYALRIYDQYFDIPEVKTEAQKHQIAMQRAREDFNKRLDAMRKEYKAREQEIVREAKLQADNRIAREQLLNKRRQEAYREKRFETELVQKYRTQILRKLNGITKKLVRPTDSEHVPQELIKSINDFAKTLVGSGAFTSQKAENLKRAFDAIGEAAQNPNFNLASMYDEDIAVKLDNLKSILEGRRFSDLSSAELKKVREITDYFAHIIKMSNEAFSESIKERISDLQSDAMDSARDVGSNRKRMGTAFQTGLLKPVTFFELLDNPTLEKLYTVIRNGEGDWYRVVKKSKEFLQKIKKEYNFKNWKNDTVEIELERGGNLTLTVGEAMSVYATARRKNAKYQGADHLMKGGAVLEKDALKKLKKVKKEDVDIRSLNIPLTIKDIQQISSALTEEQKGFANKMVEYLSTDMAELGNERTMRIYGIRKFNESNYFPIRSAGNFRYTKPGVQDDARIKHMSMTKNTTPHANNPVIIGDFTVVAMNHCNDMALYYGFVLALEDFTRVYNYKKMDADGTNQKSVKQYLEKAFGKRADSYIMQLLTDINGGVKAQAGTNVINKMMSKAKKDAVFASLSVAVQQLSAIARTMLYLNPKYLAKTTFSKRSWNELKEYAPVAGVKEMGYFDANIGRQAVDWMLDEKYEGLKEKAFALFKDGNYRDDILSFLPAYMDRVVWGHIWEAVKAETKDKTDLEVGSKELLEAAGERFTYIIDRTQVYDSVFSRSEWMRSKDTGVKTVMAFMAEPVTNLNMLYNAVVKARHGDVGFLAKALSAYAISVALNSALKALVTAGRDDDEEKSYLEKYLSSFISGIIEEPFGMIPYLKDAISIAKGYDSKRMDTQVIANFVDSIKTIFNSNKSDYEKLKSVASAVGTVIGVPVKNIWRDTEMIYNGVMDIVRGTTEATTDKGIEYAVKGVLGIETPNTARQYVDAYFEGDQGHLEKTYGNLSEKYEGDEDKINTQIKTALGEGYRDGAYTEEQVIEFLEDYFGMDEDEAYWQAQKWKNNENDDWTKYSDFIEALESGENIDAVIEEYYSHGADKRDLSSAMTSYFKEKYLSVYESDPEAVRDIEETMLAVYEKLGYEYDSNDIFWKFQEWEGGNDYSKYGDFYEAIESGTELRSTINFYVEHGVSKQTLATNITKNYKEQYIELYHTDRAAADRLRRQLIEAYAALGYDRQDKAKDIAKWLE